MNLFWYIHDRLRRSRGTTIWTLDLFRLLYLLLLLLRVLFPGNESYRYVILSRDHIFPPSDFEKEVTA
jgi:hypothetical protein